MKLIKRLLKNPLFQTILLTAAFFIISALVVFYSLGYEVNWRARTIRQTGIISLSSDIKHFSATVTIEGVNYGPVFPVRYAHAFPGPYDIAIHKDGYQDWEQIAELEPNKVLTYWIILVKQKPTELVVDPNTKIDTLNKKNIEIRQNELWLEGVLFTRYSDNILAASWYPDNQHLVIQAGDTVWLADVRGRQTQKIMTLPSKTEPLVYGFQENGRVFLYKQNGVTKALELFDRF